MSVGIFNARSSIALEFLEMIPPDEDWEPEPDHFGHDRYLICSGHLEGARLHEMGDPALARTWLDNFTRIAAFCDVLFEKNPVARVCIIGSESGIKGSFDMAYAGAKAAMHLYVQRKRLEHPEQQLVGIAPTVIWDSGMTQRRPDLEALQARGEATRMRRWLTAAEVAEAARWLLYGASTYSSNTIFRMNGGAW